MLVVFQADAELGMCTVAEGTVAGVTAGELGEGRALEECSYIS